MLKETLWQPEAHLISIVPCESPDVVGAVMWGPCSAAAQARGAVEEGCKVSDVGIDKLFGKRWLKTDVVLVTLYISICFKGLPVSGAT